MNFPASGVGQNSKYFDSDLLLNGSYQIISVTVHSSSRDEGHTNKTATLRKGLLLVPSDEYSGYYVPVSTADGYLNGIAPSQEMSDVVILAEEVAINETYILGGQRLRETSDMHHVVPAYLTCTVFENKIYYNNKSVIEITDEQWQECQRIKCVSSRITKYSPTGEDLRALLWKRVETFST